MNEMKLLGRHIAEILKGKANVTKDFCTITRPREINTMILERKSKASLNAGFSFEGLDSEGKALNLGEVPLIQEEIQPFIEVLVEKKIKISALHNHWLFNVPPILYLHFQSIDYPVEFARKVALAFEHIENRNKRRSYRSPRLNINFRKTKK